MIRNDNRADTRAKIVDAAARLLQEEGPGAVTTRGVAQAAGIQAPTIYRLFGDKDGLLEAVAEHVMATYVSSKAAIVEAAAADDVDPVDDLRAGWRAQIDFGVANPALFRLLSDPNRVMGSEAAESGRRVLQARIHRVALAGRLRASEARAVYLVQAAGTGAIHILLSTSPDQRDPGLADSMFEAVLAQIVTDPEPALRVAHAASDAPAESAALGPAVALRAAVNDLEMFSEPERALLGEWLDRAIAALQ